MIPDLNIGGPLPFVAWFVPMLMCLIAIMGGDAASLPWVFWVFFGGVCTLMVLQLRSAYTVFSGDPPPRR